MKRRNLLTVVLCGTVCISVQAQTIQSGTTLVLQSGTSISTNQDLIIEENADLQNEGAIYTSADVTNHGNNHLSGRLIFNGKEDQFIDGKDSFSVNLLEVNTAKSLSLNSKVAVTDQVKFNEGILYTTTTHPLLFKHAALDPVESGRSHIYGTAIMEERTIGSGAIQFLGAGINAGSDKGNVTITRVTGDNAVTQIGEDNSIAVKWDISTSVENAGNHNVTFSWLPEFDNSNNINELGLYANLSFKPERFVLLTNKERHHPHVVVDASTRMRICTREELDFINRTFTLSSETALTTVVEENKITMFPNPAVDHINLVLENFDDWATHVEVRLTDVYGKQISSNTYLLNGNLITINGLGVLAPGIYRVNVIHGQKVQVINFLKN